MSPVRRAAADDAEEVLRLRQVMIDAMSPDSPTDWQAASLPALRDRLAGPDGGFAAFVVDHPERPGALAALVVGTLEYRIGGPGRPGGLLGYVFSVATDPDARRRGYARVHGRAAGVVPRARRGARHADGLPRSRAPLRVDGLHARRDPLDAAVPLSRLGSTACP